MITFTIDYPPSVNTYYRHISKGKLAGRTLISEKGRAYRQKVISKIHGIKKQAGMLEVIIDLYPPDNRKRDIDNTVKALFDSLTHAGVWDDDSQVKKLSLTMMPRLDRGCAVVTIIPR